MRAALVQTLSRLLLLLLFCAPSLRADDVPQFLFLIDLSPQMARRQPATAQTVYDLIRTGFHDRIQPGEKFALWFYGSRLQTNAPFTWDSARDIELAHRATALFTGRIYSKLRPREQTLADAAPFLAASPRLTIFILTDGFQPVTAAPFDTEINAALAEHRDEFARAEKPLLITLFAEKGKWIAANVHTNLNGPVEIAAPAKPDLLDKAISSLRSAPPAKSAPNPLEQAEAVLRDALIEKPKPKTNAPAQVAALTQIATAFGDEPALPKPVLTSEPPPKKVEEPKPVEITQAPPPEPKPKIIDIPKPIEKPIVEVAIDPSSRRGNESSPAIALPTTNPTPPAQSNTQSPIAESPTPTTLPVQTALAQTPPTPPPAAKNPFPWTILFATLCLIAAIGGRAFARARFRAKNPGSIITQALPTQEGARRKK
jgi:hypothetical protein